MNATFTLAAVYQVKATCVSPLRTGAADGNIEEVLRDSKGNFLIQGSSIAGAIRDWLSNNNFKAYENRLMGTTNGGGSLIVSDGVFKTDKLHSRPRLRIDGRTGAAANGAKFDVSHIPSKTEFEFSLTWLGSKEKSKELEAVEAALGALNSGSIVLGSQKANGFGRVSLKVNKQVYDMFDAADRDAWLNGDFRGALLELQPSPSEGYVTFTFEGSADNLLVKGSSPLREGGRTTVVNIEENGAPIIPGSSVKGAVRARVKYICSALGLGEEFVNGLFGSSEEDGEEVRPGLVRFSDVVLDKSKPRTVSRIRINRFTGGVMNQALINERPLSSPVRFTVKVPQGEKAGCALVAFALRDLGLGLYNLGSGDSIGRGRIVGKKLTAKTAGGNALKLSFQSEKAVLLEDASHLMDSWRNGLEGSK